MYFWLIKKLMMGFDYSIHSDFLIHWTGKDIDENLIIDVPAVPQTCFTELKLSQSRAHAREYGRLGIGGKRPMENYSQQSAIGKGCTDCSCTE
jgi:hypothetical protein